MLPLANILSGSFLSLAIVNRISRESHGNMAGVMLDFHKRPSLNLITPSAGTIKEELFIGSIASGTTINDRFLSPLVPRTREPEDRRFFSAERRSIERYRDLGPNCSFFPGPGRCVCGQFRGNPGPRCGEKSQRSQQPRGLLQA